MLITNYDIGYINQQAINRCSKVRYVTIPDIDQNINHKSSKQTYTKQLAQQKFLNKTKKNYIFKKS
jgi:hypothetical protein